MFLDRRLGCLKGEVSDEVERFLEAVDTILGQDSTQLDTPPYIWKYLPALSPSFRRFDHASLFVYHEMKLYMEEAVERYMLHPTPPDREKSLLEKLILKFGPKSQVPVVMSMDGIIGGTDTTGSSAAFLLHDLATHPVQQEQEKFNRMRYLKACLKESQRLRPAAGGMARITQVDMVLGGHHIPAGSHVVFMNICSMVDKKNFPDPDAFIPERWLRRCPQKHTAHSFAAIPFSHGPRMCIGRRFAELELLTLVIKMLQRFHLEYEGEVVGKRVDFTIRPDRTINLRMVEREE